MSDWEEIRRLAADFQKAQSAGVANKLSERNCIEIVTKLIQLKLIDVIYTNDGKEYLTNDQLVREIKDELYVAGGRIGVVDLAKTTNVEFSQIEYVVEKICKEEDDCYFILGQIVTSTYLDNMATEINETLQQRGMVNITKLSNVDLPLDFVRKHVIARLGSIIEGFKDDMDENTIVTPSYIARNRAKVRGILSAITMPTSCSALASRFGIQERLFMSLADELIKTKRVPGVLSGRSAMNANYVPHSFAKSQNAWIESFYSSNGYLEYSAISRLGIGDPKGYLKKKYMDEKLVFLGSCVLGPPAVDQVKSALDNAMVTGSWIDLVPNMPSVLSQSDEDELVQLLIKDKPNSLVLGSTTVLSMPLVEKVRADIEATMEARAKEDVDNGVIAKLIIESRGVNIDDDDKMDKKDERRKKAAGGKAGGGAQGRETKTKSTKKKGGKRKDDDWGDSDDEKKPTKGKGGNKKDLEFKSLDDLKATLESMSILADIPEEVYEELAQYLLPGLTSKYREVAMSMYQATLTKSMHNKRKTHSELQEEVNSLYTSFRLYEKGLKEIKNDANKENLAKHLLKTTASQILDSILLYVAEENMIKVPEAKELSASERQNLIKELPSDIAEPAMKLNKAVAGKSADDFLKTLEEESLNVCDVMLKKQDKKKDKQILFNHKIELLDKLGSCEDPALGLHLAALILFQHFTGNIIQASGKFVPTILSFVQEHLTLEQNQLLSNHQQLVVKQLKERSL